MTLELEDRLWAQLEAAALRETRRRPAARAAAAMRRPFRAWRGAAALAAATAVAIAAALSVTGERPAPQFSADRIVLPGAQLTAGTRAFGSLWAYDDASGSVLRVDPRSHRIVARMRVPASLDDVAIAAGAGSLWAVPVAAIRHSSIAPEHPRPVAVARIDPRANRVVARVRVPAPVQPVGILPLGGAIWVWGERGAVKVDPPDGRPVVVIRRPGERIMAFTATDARASLITDVDELVTFDARTGVRLATIPITTPTVRGKLVSVGGSVVTSRAGGLLAAVDPITGDDRWVAHLGSQPLDLVVTGGRLWALVHDPAAARSVLLALDPGTGHTVARVPLPADDARTLGGGAAQPAISTASGQLLVPR